MKFVRRRSRDDSSSRRKKKYEQQRQTKEETTAPTSYPTFNSNDELEFGDSKSSLQSFRDGDNSNSESVGVDRLPPQAPNVERQRINVNIFQHAVGLWGDYWYGRWVAWLFTTPWGVRYLHSISVANVFDELGIAFISEERFITLPPTPTSPERQVRTRLYRRAEDQGRVLPAMLFIHGGGYLVGGPEQHIRLLQDMLRTRSMQVIAPAYRRALDHPYPAALDDCHGILQWMHNNHVELNIRNDTYMIAGQSAGGGLTAALTLLNRDLGNPINIAFQMPLYPMLDYRFVTRTSNMYGSTYWDSPASRFAWRQLLRSIPPGEPVPPYASPSLNKNYTGFPPTISIVANLEPFADETISYIDMIRAANVPTQFRVYRGAFHAFHEINRNAGISINARQFVLTAFDSYYDQYILLEN